MCICICTHTNMLVASHKLHREGLAHDQRASSDLHCPVRLDLSLPFADSGFSARFTIQFEELTPAQGAKGSDSHVVLFYAYQGMKVIEGALSCTMRFRLKIMVPLYPLLPYWQLLLSAV